MGLSPADRVLRFDHEWLDFGHTATVEPSSEDPSFPVESVFNPNERPGWGGGASKGSEQTARPNINYGLPDGGTNGRVLAQKWGRTPTLRCIRHSTNLTLESFAQLLESSCLSMAV